MFSVKLLTDIGQAVLSNQEGALTKLVKNKLEDEARDILFQLLPIGGGAGERITKAISTGGQSEFDRARSKFLNQLRPPSLPYSGIVRKFGRATGIYSARASRFRKKGYHARSGVWQASSWATSRDDWLDNAWRHDWRSQPRDVRGRWIPGRLDYIDAQLQYRGRKKGRTVLRRRKLRRLRRLHTKREIRKLLGKK